jgi:hypothetical protein
MHAAAVCHCQRGIRILQLALARQFSTELCTLLDCLLAAKKIVVALMPRADTSTLLPNTDSPLQ